MHTDDEMTKLRSPRTRKSWLVNLDLLYPVAVVAAVLLLSALSISGSSLANWSRTGAPDESALVAGHTRPIRSDEWLATSPLKTGRADAGFPDSGVFGMGEIDTGDIWRPQLPSTAIPAALYSPFNLPLTLLPVEQGFALYWWLPFAACALGVYAWLRLMRVGKGVAFASSVIVTTAPAAVWWSGWVAQSIAHATIPCAIAIAATRLFARRPWLGITTSVVAGLSAAGLPWWYQPWTIPVALFTAGVTVLWGLGDAEHRRAFVMVGIVAGAVFALEEVVYLLHERSYYEALANTAYPGARREVGGGISIGKLFSSLFAFQLTPPDRVLQQENLSEVSMGWTIALPLALVAMAFGRRSLLRDRERILVLGTGGLALVLTSWCLVRWPSLLGRATLLSFSQPQRVAPFVGFFGVIALALLGGVPDRRARLIASTGRAGVALIAVGMMFLTAWAATDFKTTFLPSLSTATVYLAVFAVGVLVVVLFSRWWRIALGAATVVAVVTGALVNPLMHGLGAIDDSYAARVVRSVDRRLVEPAHGRWATDSLYTNALLNAGGLPSLTSYNDPVDEKGWHILDPRGVYENEWNRFGYIAFDWRPGLEQPSVVAVYPDQIHVAADPCDPLLAKLRLRAIIASTPQLSSCLTEQARFLWQGQHFFVYSIRNVDN
jgi:hypothetical protein